MILVPALLARCSLCAVLPVGKLCFKSVDPIETSGACLIRLAELGFEGCDSPVRLVALCATFLDAPVTSTPLTPCGLILGLGAEISDKKRHSRPRMDVGLVAIRFCEGRPSHGEIRTEKHHRIVVVWQVLSKGAFRAAFVQLFAARAFSLYDSE